MRWSVKFRSARGQTRGSPPDDDDATHAARARTDGRSELRIDRWTAISKNWFQTHSLLLLRRRCRPSVRLIGNRGRMEWELTRTSLRKFGIGKERPLEIWGRRRVDRLRRLGLIFRLCEKIRCNFDLEELEFRQCREREREACC